MDSQFRSHARLCRPTALTLSFALGATAVTPLVAAVPSAHAAVIYAVVDSTSSDTSLYPADTMSSELDTAEEISATIGGVVGGLVLLGLLVAASVYVWNNGTFAPRPAPAPDPAPAPAQIHTQTQYVQVPYPVTVPQPLTPAAPPAPQPQITVHTAGKF
ncbi:MAG: hypothetical protein SPI77_01720 [Corynebacterium sp.]|nr:hypothetical protein [Corynebacterium sp.]